MIVRRSVVGYIKTQGKKVVVFGVALACPREKVPSKTSLIVQ
jgi:hypothetical protein